MVNVSASAVRRRRIVTAGCNHGAGRGRVEGVGRDRGRKAEQPLEFIAVEPQEAEGDAGAVEFSQERGEVVLDVLAPLVVVLEVPLRRDHWRDADPITGISIQPSSIAAARRWLPAMTTFSQPG